MRTLIMKSVAALALTATVSAPIAMAADTAEEKAVKARRGYFQVVLINAGPLFGMAKGDIDYDAEAASTAAANLDALAGMNVLNMYPAGSDKPSLPGKSRAQDKIWSDLDGFVGKFQDFGKATDGLVAAAGNGLDALRPAVGALGASCKGCHDNYRDKDF
ncbi:MAG: c-type cytochrome [Paracoccaceae bacterium]